MNYVKKMKKKKPQDSSLSATDISMLSLETIKKNLNVGDVYTQTELCKILGQPIFRNSNQRKAQLKTFQRFFDLTKEDNLIIIDKIYDTIQPVTPRKIREDSVYAQYMQYLLMNYLYLQEGNVAAMTSRQWWVVLSLINENYHKLFSDNSNDKEWIKNVASYITDEQIQNFKSRTSNKYYNIFNQTLKSMEDKRFIMSEKVYMVGTDWCDLHEADSDEKELWLETDRAALQELNKILLNDSDEPAMYRNLKTVSQVYRKEQKYQDMVEEIFLQDPQHKQRFQNMIKLELTGNECIQCEICVKVCP